MQDELSNDKRFQKTVSGSLKQLRAGMGDGLFTVGCIYALFCAEGEC